MIYFLLFFLKQEPIQGRFYGEEMQKVKEDETSTYRIEKVLKKRLNNGSNEMLVKFFDDPREYWIKNSDIVN